MTDSLPELTELLVTWRIDPLIRIGHLPESNYLEFCWLPSLGPAGVLLYRRLVWLTRDRPQVTVDALDLSQSLGLGSPRSASARLWKTLIRLQRFGLITTTPDRNEILVSGIVPPLSPQAVERLTPTARRVHDELTPNQ